MTVRTAPDTDALLPRLARLRERVAELVAERGATDPTAGDPLRGLYLSEEGVRHLLEPSAGPYPSPVFPDAESAPYGPLELLAGRLGLTELDTRILLIALAPDLDRSYEQLYGYLNDDVSRRRATVGLALDLCGLPVHLARVRARFAPSAPLSALGLLTVEDPERPFLGRALRVPDRLIAHLLGDDSLDSGLMGRVRPLGSPPSPDARSASDARPGSSAVSPEDGGFTARLAARLAAAPVTVHLREYREGDGLVRAAAALRTAGIEALHFTPPAAEEDLSALLPRLLREARLRDCAVVVSPLPEKPGPLVRALTAADVSVLFVGPQPYDPQWSDRDPLVLDVPRPPAGAVDAWAAALGAGADGPGFDLAATVAPYRLGGDRIERAARAAVDLAAFDGTEVTAAHLRLAARLQSASGLERHARRIRPDVGWDDLVLPDKPLAELRELALRARHRDRVLGDWRLSAGGGRGRGVLGLFAGESGTGKTLSAEVVAAELGLDLYVVQLSSIVDKYVGETEKNLERIFTEADRTDAVLLFDEADAVFGKRSEVKDSHDKYANMESAYLLQRLESFDGIALLTTNLRANIDEAFTRRLDLVVDFPFPDTAQRLALWRHSLAAVPRADDIDAAAVARDFELAGGSIRSAVVTAAYAAAGRGGPVTTADLREGAEREYRKAGRLVPGEGNW
ncbi:ATP-binding protein [Streptomyces griseiscabiei]|uniref:ATP-binding protein n=2 Tax=Streptomyces griseiscabiei TaxID=2993540 RepID=A0ABU4LBP4_9ACTN|nr:ATP-binding protein [Streptomyces griseiscabiei]MBZ3903933.1 ATP-binding protein [Streptomyces griseiscabiei]MDX2912856.1 ATP-binding protein [Streptomyces griseiscabiei]